MKMLLTMAAVFGIAAPALAETLPPAAYTVEMWNSDPADKKRRMVFSDESVAVLEGAAVTWLPTAKGHNVEFIAGPAGVELPEKSKLGDEVTVTFDQPGVYVYVCSPHAAMGMIGIVVVGEPTPEAIEAASNAKLNGPAAKKLDALLAELAQ